jgi:crossover junction endodeoxyribonuclease RuvC
MRILGIDPGFATVGLGLVEAASSADIQVIEWLTIETAAGIDFADRLVEIHADLAAFLEETKPELIVIEKLFFATNVKTAIDVAQARGVIMLTAAERHIPLLEITPLQLKSGITGDGSADKQQVQSMMVQMLHLTEIPKPDDAADALAMAVYGALHQRMNRMDGIV